MGTRGLLGHIIRSKGIRKGAYNHFDSYPDGLGSKLATFIDSLREEQIKKMAENVAKIQWIQDERGPAPTELQTRYSALGFADTGVGSGDASDWYCLLRNVQGATSLPHILDGSLGHQVDGTDFEEDTLFCEWSCFVDWEAKVVRAKCANGHEKTATFAEVSPEWMDKFAKECSENSDE